MHHYRTLSAAQLADDKYFQQWIRSHGHDAQIDGIWQAWLAGNQDRAETVTEARNILLAVYNDRQHLPEASTRERTWARIESTLQGDQPLSEPIKSISTAYEPREAPVRHLAAYYKWAATAALLVAASAVFFWWKEKSPENLLVVPTQTQATAVPMHFAEASSQSVTVMLEDGSSVVLQPGSRLDYPEHFASRNRKVALTGEAFFEVSKDQERPFFVESSYITTRVLGTSFSVRVISGEDNALVSVKTGKVSVFRTHTSSVDSSEVILAPSQQVTYSVSEEKLTKSTVKGQPSLAVARYHFEFEDAPLRDVFKVMESAYRVQINYDEATFSDCLLNASLEDIPFEEKIRLICKAVGATYKMNGAHITISGNGC